MSNNTDNQIEHRCELCSKVFRKASTLAAHLCEPRRRLRARGERGVEIGYQAFLAFYQDLHGSSRLKSPDDFDTSPYYRAFVKFGQYCVSTRVIDPRAYMTWLLTNRRKIDHWATDLEYTGFLVEWLPRESAAAALRRGQDWAQQWAEQNHSLPQHCLRYGNTNALCHAVTSGRISAWLLYNCDSGQQFLSGLSNEHIAMTWPYIDSDRWQQTFHGSAADQVMCQELLRQAGW